MIGNARDAKLIRDYAATLKAWARERNMRHDNKYRDYDKFHGPVRQQPVIPEGWERIGAGAYRAAFLSPDGVVYKVEHTYDDEYGQSNRGEYENACRMLFRGAERIPGLRLPKFTLYTLDDNRPVMAMEYVKGEWSSEAVYCDTWGREVKCKCERFDGECNYVRWNEFGRMCGLSDIHGGNIVFIPEQRTWVLVDLGG